MLGRLRTLLLGSLLLVQPVQASETYTVTAYCLHGTMRDGTYTRVGSAAADPNVHPLGSILLVEGLGYFVVRDTGSGVLGQHVDLWMDSCYDATQFGRQYLTVEEVR